MHGHLTVITGPMFAGKTAALLDLIEAAAHTDTKFRVIKPKRDTRQPGLIKSRTGGQWPATEVSDSGEFDVAVNTKKVFIDEGHFFDKALVRTVCTLMIGGTDVVVAGVDYNCKTKPFPTMASLLHKADQIVRVFATCATCKVGYAAYTVRNSKDVTEYMVGSDIYEPICYPCLQRRPEEGLTVLFDGD